jgi:SAM-dependent methyltransferase
MPRDPDLHALVAGFADAAVAYERGRPEYPPAVVERVVAELGVRRGARVLDLGAGTGKLSRPLLAAGLDVVAVEPVDGMRAALAGGVGAARALDGRAEAIPLPEASVDAVVCAEAFHWFDGDRAADELHRVLRPGGGVVALWLESDGAGPWAKDAVALLEPLWERASHPSLIEHRRAEPLERHAGFGPVRRAEVGFSDDIDREAALAWFASFSVVGALPDAERAELLGRLAAILDDHGVTSLARAWRADLWITRRRDGPAHGRRGRDRPRYPR